ncbi:MAG: hypothetical protein J6B94_05585 [Lachnospiraceae bacterium]|nr:hypothetical protein [Lachnospiraceae bacterium]
MKSKHKALLLSMCAVLLVAVSIFGTLAYLTDKDTVTNTFTVGSVGLSLDEADVKTDGSYETNHDSRVQANKYHLLPGHTYYKDPTVTVDAGSEDAYVRMMVKVEGLDSLKKAMPTDKFPTFYNNDLFLLQNLCVDKDGNLTWNKDVWQFETFHAEGTYANCYEFRYVGNDTENPGNGIVVKSANETVLDDLFKTITVPGEIDNEHLAYLADVKIVVTAHAIQADGFADADEAWAAFSK